MKLYLSSYHLGDSPELLLSLTNNNKNVAIISNASDNENIQYRKESVDYQINDLASLGLIPKEIDLRNFFGKEQELKKVLKDFGMLWVKGGNTFVLRRAMAYSGLDKIILEKNRDKDFIYGGYSAGICVLAPTLNGLEIVDDPNEIPSNYNSEIIWEGLKIINYWIAPHFKSTHEESNKIDETVQYYIKNKMSYQTLRDGEVIISNNSLK